MTPSHAHPYCTAEPTATIDSRFDSRFDSCFYPSFNSNFDFCFDSCFNSNFDSCFDSCLTSVLIPVLTLGLNYVVVPVLNPFLTPVLIFRVIYHESSPNDGFMKWLIPLWPLYGEFWLCPPHQHRIIGRMTIHTRGSIWRGHDHPHCPGGGSQKPFPHFAASQDCNDCHDHLEQQVHDEPPLQHCLPSSLPF